jgi:hypothetical protein
MSIAATNPTTKTTVVTPLVCVLIKSPFLFLKYRAYKTF